MKLDLIQHFISAADTVLSDTLACPTTVEDLSMENDAYRRHGIAAEVRIAGDVEGRVILDLEPGMVESIARSIGCDAGMDAAMAHETICEVANQVIGNAVTALNDRGFRFRIQPPLVHDSDHGFAATQDTEALVMSIVTSRGRAYMNIALHYAGEGLASAD